MLDDVVRIDLVPAAECKLPVPMQVWQVVMQITNLSSWQPQTAIQTIGAATLSLAYNVQDGDDGEIDSAPSLTQIPKTVKSGIIYEHTLQVPITAFFEATKVAIHGLEGVDFHVVLTTDDNTHYLMYSLTGSSRVTIEEENVRQKGTVKITMQSASQVIRLE